MLKNKEIESKSESKVTKIDDLKEKAIMRMNRRTFVKMAGAAAGVLAFGGSILRYIPSAEAQILGGSLDPTIIDKYVTKLVIPPAMPRTAVGKEDYYEIAVRQFKQQILPSGMPKTTVWSYGSVNHSDTFNYPAFTIEADFMRPVRVKWINGLVDEEGNYLPHLLPVDPTLHWANPPGGNEMRDMRPTFETTPGPYDGPVPMVPHLHGGHSAQESDGYAEAWYLPANANIPADFATEGTWYDFFKTEFQNKFGVEWEPGTATFQYQNDQRAGTFWYHDHTLGMTRLNVYAGPAGFYLLRRGPGDLPNSVLPGPAPGVGADPFGRFYEIPIAIQDRSFNDDGSLFYPDTRAFFEGLDPNQLQIPFIGEEACDGQSDISPIWNPEFFGNTMVVNGRTWPYLEVEPRRYRFRFLNGCNSRFLILKMSNDMPFWQIGSDGGFLPKPVQLTELLMGPAERADVIVDFTDMPVGTEIILQNLGPDEPFGGGTPDTDFDPADPNTTGQVMKFAVVSLESKDTSINPALLKLPAFKSLGPATNTRQVSLNEEDSMTVRVIKDEDSNVVLDCENGETFGPRAALLGILDGSGNPVSKMWDDGITENPAQNAIETWEIFNFTADAHPIHIHEVQFQVVNRQLLETEEVDGEDVITLPATPVGNPTLPEVWETGYKDTVIAYPSQVTRVKAKFDLSGLYVWHCHIVEHEDNEMMRPYFIGPNPPAP
ncbi:MAG: multicopper oxidase domain-containing protein [Candidatus Methanoperedens sp.]|nr:multicopper oxidase domain-containing protein [Candidatus Methanoperedens sp.]CAG0950213.1 Spore coat protein A [Methanosarcinales archaeon]